MHWLVGDGELENTFCVGRAPPKTDPAEPSALPRAAQGPAPPSPRALLAPPPPLKPRPTQLPSAQARCCFGAAAAGVPVPGGRRFTGRREAEVSRGLPAAGRPLAAPSAAVRRRLFTRRAAYRLRRLLPAPGRGGLHRGTGRAGPAPPSHGAGSGGAVRAGGGSAVPDRGCERPCPSARAAGAGERRVRAA